LINPKLAAIIAGGAFFLSFLIGLFSHSGFGLIFFRALIFAVVFFGIAAGVQFVYYKFLNETASPEGADGEEGADGKKTDENKGFGENIDLVLQDDDFTEGFSPQRGAAQNMPDNATGEKNDEPALLETLDDDVEELEPIDDEKNGKESQAVLKPLDQKTNAMYDKAGDGISEESIIDDLNIGAFIPGIPGIEDIGIDPVVSGRAESVESAGSKTTEYARSVGTVEMSMEKMSNKALDFDIDGQKAAGAIQTLLKKDEE
jgi:hypothetical protein